MASMTWLPPREKTGRGCRNGNENVYPLRRGPLGDILNVELLIHAIVRQTTILIAQLATSHGLRAPLPHIADQVFADLVKELDRQGVSRQVGADMFGMGLRTYRRKVQRLRES